MAVHKVVSIEITDTITKLCLVSYNKKIPVVYKSLTLENPEGSVEDGFVIDRGVYGSFLKEQLHKEKIKCKDVVFVLSGTKIMSREAVIPDMKDDLILGFIQDERDEYFPMDTSDYVFTYNILDRIKVDSTIRIMIYAAQEILLKNLIALAGELDLKLRTIDYEGNAIYQWQKKPTHDPITIYLQINERNSQLTILENGVLALQRNMAFGVDALAERLIASGFYENISRKNAIERLTEKEFMYPSYENMTTFYPEDDDENRLHDVKCSINEGVRPLIDNITRVLEYYNSKNRDAVVERIYIGGIGAQIKNLRKLLQSEFIGIEFHKILELPGIKIHRNNPIQTKQGSEFTACIGAANVSINFYEDKSKYKLSTTLVFCIIAVLLVIGASGVIVYNGKVIYEAALKERNELDKQREELEATGIEILEAKAMTAVSSANEIIEWDISTFRFNEMWNQVIECLENDSTENMLVSSISSNESGLSLNITVNTKEEAAKLIEQLRYIPYFSNVQVYSISETVDVETGRTSVAFTALCTYKLPAEETADETTEETEGGDR